MWSRLTVFILAAATLAACGGAEEQPTQDWMLANAQRYLNDTQWRRDQLEASLWEPDLPYARKRLAGYALPEGGWDQLPIIHTTVTPVGDDPTPVELLDTAVPETRAEWLALGERAFWSMPMRRDGYLEWLVTQPEVWDDIGLQRDERGNVRGIVRFTDARGKSRVGATCGLCHGDAGLPGRATRELDLGRGRDLFSRAVYNRPTEYTTWGPGRVDVTDDQVTDALSIPDLWGVSEQSHMNVSGAIKLETPAALAIRFETQYVVGHSLEARPDRTISWALMMYVMSLEAPTNTATGSQRGQALFEQRCASCHVPEQGYSGGLYAAELIGSDPLAANSRMRGTGYYKTSSLIGIADGAPYLHDASAATLRELLQTHAHASDLEQADMDELIRFLETL